MAKRTFSDSTVQHKTGTAAQWTSVNPTLAKGEIGVELDMGRIKIGDGVTAWGNLPYIGQSSTALVGHIQQQYTVESGYLTLDGGTYSRTTYAALWAWANSVSGLVSASPSKYQFGTGDESTTFTVPNHIDRVWQGGSTIGQKEAGVPDITGYVDYASGYGLITTSSSPSGAFYSGGGSGSSLPDGGKIHSEELLFAASHSNAIYGKSTTVQPSAIILIPQIKY